MVKRVLVYAEIYIDEDDLHDLYIYEVITEPKLIKDLDTDEVSLSFKSEGEEGTVELWDVEWYRSLKQSYGKLCTQQRSF